LFVDLGQYRERNRRLMRNEGGEASVEGQAKERKEGACVRAVNEPLMKWWRCC
jgi:hypothetical protein